MSSIWAARDAILARAAKDFAKGEFRFVAQAVSHLVFAEPDNQAARAMLADTFEQLGYASESSTWRNAYLFGAQELRQGMPKAPPRSTMPRETLAALRTEQLWDVLGVRLNGPKAEGKRIVLNWNFTDTERDLHPQSGKLRADLCRRRASRRCRRRLHAGARRAGRSDRQADDVPGSGRLRQDQGRPAIRCGSPS